MKKYLTILGLFTILFLAGYGLAASLVDDVSDMSLSGQPEELKRMKRDPVDLDLIRRRRSDPRQLKRYKRVKRFIEI